MTTPETLDPVAYERRGFYHTLHGRLYGLFIFNDAYLAEEIRRYEENEARSEDPMKYREQVVRALEPLLES